MVSTHGNGYYYGLRGSNHGCVTNAFVLAGNHVEYTLWTGNNIDNITAVEMSKSEYNSLLFRISRRLDDINDLEHVLFICREKLEPQADQDIHSTLSLLRKLEDGGFLGVDEMQEVKDILKAVEEWDLYEKVVKFESTRREYKEFLEMVINVLEERDDLERLMSTAGRVRTIPEERKKQIQDVRSLVQVLEDMNCLGIDRFGMLKEIFTELNDDELLTELAQFQKRRVEDETRERRKGNNLNFILRESMIGKITMLCYLNRLFILAENV